MSLRARIVGWLLRDTGDDHPIGKPCPWCGEHNGATVWAVDMTREFDPPEGWRERGKNAELSDRVADVLRWERIA